MLRLPPQRRVASWSLAGAQMAAISSGRVPRKALKRLNAVRGPSESYSEAILCLSKQEAIVET